MKKIIFLLIIFLWGIPPKKVIQNNYLKFSSGELYQIDKNDFEKSVRKYLKEIRQELAHNFVHEFPLVKNKSGYGSSQHLIFQQTYNDIPVFGNTVRVHINNKQIISSISSNIEPINISTTPTYSKIEALNKLKNDIPFSKKTYLKYIDLQIYGKVEIFI